MVKIRLIAICALLLSACGSGIEVEAGFEQTLIEEPTLFLQSEASSDLLASADIEPGPRHDEFTEETIDQTIETLFDSGDGDDLFVLKRSLIPTIVFYALETGDGDPDAMPITEWLGEIDGRIDTAINRTDYKPPSTISEQDVTTTVDSGLGPLLRQSAQLDDEQTLDETIIARAATAELNTTSPGQSQAEQNWIDENNEIENRVFQILKTLDEAGRLQLPPDVANVENFIERERSIRLAVILDSTGQPLIVDGEPVTAGDWSQSFRAFDTRNAQTEQTE